MVMQFDQDVLNDEGILLKRTRSELESYPRFKLIDLFAGAGGMTLGFTGFGHRIMPVWANDLNKDAVTTYNKNFGGHCLGGDIINIVRHRKEVIPQADIVIGGPPCQGFSLLNQKRQGDPRRQLWRPFLEVVALSEAKIFVIENVPQLLNSAEHEAIIAEAEELGFKLTWEKLCAADYGVSQMRYRAFIVGSKVGDPCLFFPPKRTHCPLESAKQSKLKTDLGFVESPKPWCTVRDVIGDLPRPVGTQIRSESPPLDLHFGRSPTDLSLRRYRAVPEEGMNRFDLQRRAPELTPQCWIRKTKGGTDLFGRMWWDRPSFTIRTEFYKPEKGRYLHPSEHRPITHREAARIQSFPDEFRFCGTKIEIARQIGNAVPPVLASRVADSIYAMLLAESTVGS